MLTNKLSSASLLEDNEDSSDMTFTSGERHGCSCDTLCLLVEASLSESDSLSDLESNSSTSESCLRSSGSSSWTRAEMEGTSSGFVRIGVEEAELLEELESDSLPELSDSDSDKSNLGLFLFCGEGHSSSESTSFRVSGLLSDFGNGDSVASSGKSGDSFCDSSHSSSCVSVLDVEVLYLLRSGSKLLIPRWNSLPLSTLMMF